MPKVSVCITDFGNPEYLKLCLKSLDLTTFKDKEVLVRSNNKKNLGLGVSSNMLARKAKGEYLFFLNNDTMVKRNIFEKLLESKADIVGCRMFNYRGEEDLGGTFYSLDRFGCPAGQTGPMFYPDGAIFIKRKVFEEIGGFDENIFAYGEDRDLCWRSLLAGHSVWFQHDAVFYHTTRSALGPTSYLRRYHSERNIIYIMLKNYTLHRLLTILPQYLFWSVLELGLMLFTNPMAIFKSYLPAYWWNIKNLKETIAMRNTVIRRIPDKELPFSRVIGKLYVLRTQGIPKWKN